MGWKNFLKPNWKKMGLFLVISILYVRFLPYYVYGGLFNSGSAVFYRLSYIFSYVLSCLLIFFWNKIRKVEGRRVAVYEWGMFIGAVIWIIANPLFVPSFLSRFGNVFYYYFLLFLDRPLYVFFKSLIGSENYTFLYVRSIISGMIYGGIISLFYWAIRYRKQEPIKVEKFWKYVFVILLIGLLIGSMFFLFKLYNVSIGCSDKNVDSEMRVYDSEGRVAGLVNGEEMREIPSSVYTSGYSFETEFDSEAVPEEVMIMDPNGAYIHEIFGVSKGNYNFEKSRSRKWGTDYDSIEILLSHKDSNVNEGEYNNFIAINIPLHIGETHQYYFDWDALARGEEGATLLIDEDNDGVFETNIVSGGELTCEKFLLKTGKSTSSKLLMMKILFVVIWVIIAIAVIVLIGRVIRHKKVVGNVELNKV